MAARAAAVVTDKKKSADKKLRVATKVSQLALNSLTTATVIFYFSENKLSQ